MEKVDFQRSREKRKKERVKLGTTESKRYILTKIIVRDIHLV